MSEDKVYFVEYRNHGADKWTYNGTLYNEEKDAEHSMKILVEQDRMLRRAATEARVSSKERPPGFTGTPSNRQTGVAYRDNEASRSEQHGR